MPITAHFSISQLHLDNSTAKMCNSVPGNRAVKLSFTNSNHRKKLFASGIQIAIQAQINVMLFDEELWRQFLGYLSTPNQRKKLIMIGTSKRK